MTKKSSPPAFERFVRWGVLALLVYAFYETSIAPSRHAATSTAAPVATSEKTKDCATASAHTASGFDMFAVPLVPSFAPALHSQDALEGKGEPAVCGQHADLRYEYSVENGPVIFSNIDSGMPTKSVTLGQGTLLHGLELGVLGMKPEGKRILTLPPHLAFGGAQDVHGLRDSGAFHLPAAPLNGVTIRARVQLLSLAPPVPVSTLPLRLLTSHAVNSELNQCGDTVYATISAWKLDGTPLYASDAKTPLTIALGASDAPYGIEQLILSLPQGADATAIIPSAYLTPLNNNTHPSALSKALAVHEMVLLHIALQPAPKSTVQP